MALTPLLIPSASPSAVSDYEKQNILISNAILNIDKQFPIDFVNDEIPIGTIVNLDGTILKAISAEPITGTKSRYVKIDHSAYTASYVTNLSGVTYDEATRGYYDGSGDLYLFDEIQAYCDNFIQNVYMQSSRDALRAMVDIYNVGFARIQNITYPTTPTRIGNICFMDDDRIAVHDDSGNNLYAYDWDGENWVQVGNAFSISIGAYNTIDMQMFGTNQIVICDVTTDDLNVYDFDGTDFSLVGGYNRALGMSNPYIAVMSATEVALTIGSSVQLYTWNGTTFSPTGSSYGLAPYTNPKICKVDTDTVIAIDTSGTSKFVELLYSGGSWSQVGSEVTLGFDGDFVRTLGTDKFLVGYANGGCIVVEKKSGVWSTNKGYGVINSYSAFDTYPDNGTVISNELLAGIKYFKRLLYADS